MSRWDPVLLYNSRHIKAMYNYPHSTNSLFIIILLYLTWCYITSEVDNHNLAANKQTVQAAMVTSSGYHILHSLYVTLVVRLSLCKKICHISKVIQSSQLQTTPILYLCSAAPNFALRSPKWWERKNSTHSEKLKKKVLSKSSPLINFLTACQTLILIILILRINHVSVQFLYLSFACCNKCRKPTTFSGVHKQKHYIMIIY